MRALVFATGMGAVGGAGAPDRAWGGCPRCSSCRKKGLTKADGAPGQESVGERAR